MQQRERAAENDEKGTLTVAILILYALYSHRLLLLYCMVVELVVGVEVPHPTWNLELVFSIYIYIYRPLLPTTLFYINNKIMMRDEER